MLLFGIIGESAITAFGYMVVVLLIINIRFRENSRDNMRKMKDM